MMPSQVKRNLMVAFLVLFLLPVAGRAGTMEITIDNAAPTGLFFAPNPAQGSATYGFPTSLNNLSLLIRHVSGTLDGDLTTVDGFLNLTFSGELALLDADGVQIGTLMIASAIIHQTGNGFAEGSIDFSVAFGQGPGETYAGTWYFSADGFGMQSQLWETGFQIMASGAKKGRGSDQENNIQSNVRPTGTIDIVAGMVAVPEPSTLLYLAAVLLPGFFLVRRYVRQPR